MEDIEKSRLDDEGSDKKDPKRSDLDYLREIMKEEECDDFLNTRIELLNNEDTRNVNMVYESMDIKSEDDYAEEYEESVEKIFNGDTGSDEKVKEIFDLCDRNDFDIRNAHLVESEEEKGEIFWEIIDMVVESKTPIVKKESLIAAIELQKKNGINLEGFTEDNDFSEIESFLENSFPNGLLDKALISRISYLPDTVCISLDGNYFIPKEKYLGLKDRYKNLPKHKVRGVNRSSSNIHPFALFRSSPMEIYSFIDEDLSDFEYLENIPEEERMRLYKLGTVSHEVGHNLYINLLEKPSRDQWQELIDNTGHLTVYSEKYSSGIHGDNIRYDEEFAEAVRLMTTNSDYLKEKYLEIYEFLVDTFPDLKGE